MIDFSILKSFTIPSGTVTQIAIDGTVVWKLPNVGGPVVLEVEKIVSNTYAGETTYNNEEFILLNIYPKTNGTVNITYGGLTKTITDTSGVEEPNAQQVFFGTFNGVSDSVTTPTSGEVTIEGDYTMVCVGTYKVDSKALSGTYCACITGVVSFGNIKAITDGAFVNCVSLTDITIPATVSVIGGITKGGGLLNNPFYGCTGLQNVTIENGVKTIHAGAFSGCTGLKKVTIPKSVNELGYGNILNDSSNAFPSTNTSNFITIDSGNIHYKIDGNCLISIYHKKLVSGFTNSIIPTYVTSIGGSAFLGCTGLTEITIPTSVVEIGVSAFNGTGLTEITIPTNVKTIGGNAFANCNSLTDVTILSNSATINNSAFHLCTKLVNLSISNGVTSIGDSAFYGCSGLTNVTIPSGITRIGKNVFFQCYLNTLTFANPTGWYVSASSDLSNPISVDVTNPSNNYTLFSSTYADYYWFRE